MPTDLTYPLGYISAKQVLMAGRAAFFGSPDLDLPTDRSQVLADDDRAPQFGYVGPQFESTRVLLLGINPGNGKNDVRAAGDVAMMPAIHAFSEHPTPELFLAAQCAYKSVCESWPVWGNHCAALLAEVGLSTDQIAYSNCLPWRTASESGFADSVARSAALLYTTPLVEELRPRIVIAVGKKASTILRYCDTHLPPMVVWNRARALTKSVELDRAAAKSRLRDLLTADAR